MTAHEVNSLECVQCILYYVYRLKRTMEKMFILLLGLLNSAMGLGMFVNVSMLCLV